MSKKIFYSIAFVLVLSILIMLYILLYKQIDNNQIKDKETVLEECSAINETVNITLITDSKYIIPTMTSMYSAIINKCQNSTYNFYIITENITKEDENDLIDLKKLSPQTVNIQIIPQNEPNLPFENMERFVQYKVGMHKIYLSQILKDIDKVIYMDGDTIVLKDLRNLYNINVDDVYSAVAKDGIYYRFPKEIKEMGLDKRGYYFNSGVMLHNLKKQRQDNIVEKLVEYIKTHNDFYGDQDVLNVVFADKLKLMSYKYNCISTFFEADDLNFLSKFFDEKLPKNTIEIYKQATIIHYAGDKPWYQNYQPMYLKEIWFDYYNKMRKL